MASLWNVARRSLLSSSLSPWVSTATTKTTTTTTMMTMIHSTTTWSFLSTVTPNRTLSTSPKRTTTTSTKKKKSNTTPKKTSPTTATYKKTNSDTIGKIVYAPPNLKIDPKSTCSPFFGLKRITVPISSSREDPLVEGETVPTPTGDDTVTDVASQEEEDHPYKDWVAFDATNLNPNKRNEGRLMIPLPQRLEVKIWEKGNAKSVVGSYSLHPKLFGQDVIRIDLLQRAVQYQRNKKRGKRKAITKTISQVSGSGRKVRRQKGSGKARAGHSRPNHWRGGAKAHGPKGSIQDYTTKLNTYVRKLALTHALSQKLMEGNLIIINDLNLPSHKTKELARTLGVWNIGGRSGTTAFVVDHVVKDTETENEDTSLVVSGLPANLVVAAGNLRAVTVANQMKINVYEILKHKRLILTLNALQAMEARLVPALK